MTAEPEWRGVGWGNALNIPHVSKKFLRKLNDEELNQFIQYGNAGCVGVNCGRAFREIKRRRAVRNLGGSQ